MRNTSIYTQITPAVLQTIKSKYNNYDNTLFSFIEISHRSEEYLNLSNRTVEKLKTYFNAE
jgi:phosphoserine aminotransferase